MYAPALHAEAVLKLNFNPARFPILTPFYASALEAWHKPNLKSLEELRHIPLHDSTPLTAHISGRQVSFDDAWKTINIKCIADLITENGHWKDIDATR
jgi:hypothetical protein